MGRLTPFLDDIVLAVLLLAAVALVAPDLWPWALAGILLYSGAKVLVLRSHLRRPAIGAEAMVGRVATALADLAPHGQVDLDGEIWEAEASAAVRRGERVRVEAVEGLLLRVAPLGVAGGEVRGARKGSVLLGLSERLRRD